MAAVISNAQLLRTENGLAASVERLSSGLKINHAKDDPAGMAISNKMKAQIDGLGKASDNASNGVSVLQIADSGGRFQKVALTGLEFPMYTRMTSNSQRFAT